MRLAILGAMTLALVAPATARDPDFSPINTPVLRGSEPVAPPQRYQPGTPVHVRWEGLYAGGQIGYSASSVNYSGGINSLVGYILRNDVVFSHTQDWQTLPNDGSNAPTFGGFIGYNLQWNDAIVGLEFNYSRMRMSTSASDTMTRSFTDDTGAPPSHHFIYDVTIAAQAALRFTDMATVRTRIGWATGPILPYAFGGFAIGRADISRSATVSYVRTDVPDPATPPITPLPTVNFGPVSMSDSKNGAIGYGYAIGVGVDMAVLPNTFVRAEWELAQFGSFQGYNIRMNSVRAAVGLRFSFGLARASSSTCPAQAA